MGGVVACLCVYMCVSASLIRLLSVNWHSTNPHTDLQIPQLMTALPQPANNNLSVSCSPFLSVSHTLFLLLRRGS